MGGSLDIVRRCIAGIHFNGDTISINPDLPDGWNSLKFRFCFRQTWVSLLIIKNRIIITVDNAPSRRSRTALIVSGVHYQLYSGETLRIPLI